MVKLGVPQRDSPGKDEKTTQHQKERVFVGEEARGDLIAA